jgi:hypothetical protein
MTHAHKGIEIRAAINGQPILETNSYTLHLMGKLGQYADRPGLSDGYMFPQAPKGWGYLLGMPFAPCPRDPKSPVLSILYRAVETAEAPDDDEDQAEDHDPTVVDLCEGWTITATSVELRPMLFAHHVCGYNSEMMPYIALGTLVSDIAASNVHNCQAYRG